MDRVHRMIAGLGSANKRAHTIARKEKTKNDAGVQAQVQGVNRHSKRKSAGPPKAIVRKLEKKKARMVKRENDLADEQMKPAGEPVNDNETAKAQLKNLST
jgi:hypothetical protein